MIVGIAGESRSEGMGCVTTKAVLNVVYRDILAPKEWFEDYLAMAIQKIAELNIKKKKRAFQEIVANF